MEKNRRNKIKKKAIKEKTENLAKRKKIDNKKN